MPDVVMFCMYAEDGRLFMVKHASTDSQRDFPHEAAGLFAVNGGFLNGGESVGEALCRKLDSDYGLSFSVTEVDELFVLQTSNAGFSLLSGNQVSKIHLFRSKHSTGELLRRLDGKVTAFHPAMPDPEGAGMVPMCRKDIADIGAAGKLFLPVALAFKAYPDLLPRI